MKAIFDAITSLSKLEILDLSLPDLKNAKKGKLLIAKMLTCLPHLKEFALCCGSYPDEDKILADLMSAVVGLKKLQILRLYITFNSVTEKGYEALREYMRRLHKLLFLKFPSGYLKGWMSLDEIIHEYAHKCDLTI